MTNEEIDRLTNDANKQGFAGALLTAEDRPLDQIYYSEGDKMYSKLYLPNAESTSQQYLRSFPLPAPSTSGLCDNFKAPKFMENQETDCV